MVDFNPEWYKKLINSTNEKNVLISNIEEILQGKPHETCLEIGLGVYPFFAENLSSHFKEYIIVERRKTENLLPKGVKLVIDDWENVKLDEKFDVIIASHVVYYFKDKKRAIDKMFASLNDNGRVIFVVNGKESDYGPIKLAFSKMIGEKYHFTYDELINTLKGRIIKEYTRPSKIKFSSYEDLFETLRISFDNYAKEYQDHKKDFLEYFKENVKGNYFIIDQKIIEVRK